MNKLYTGKNPVVIVGNGEFPAHPIPLNHLKNAGTIICADGGADQLISYNLTPNAIIGDMDSTKLRKDDFKGAWISSPNQNRTDLQKTLDWCIANNLNDVTVLGTMGRREDHSLGNLHVLDEFSQKLKMKFVTNYAVIHSFKGKRTFSSLIGQQISIVAIENIQAISTVGLKYELKNKSFPPACNGISNEAIGEIFTIKSTEPIWLFINHLN
jgi:thiamine pyrophosphokinase